MAGYHGYVNQVKLDKEAGNALVRMHNSTNLNALTKGQLNFLLGSALATVLVIVNGPTIESYVLKNRLLCQMLNLSPKAENAGFAYACRAEYVPPKQGRLVSLSATEVKR